MAEFRIEIDADSLNEWARKGTPELEQALVTIARKVMNAAKANPLPRARHAYRRKFGTDVGELNGQVCATVYNTDFTALWVEWGAHARGKTPVLGYHVMERALESVVDRG